LREWKAKKTKEENMRTIRLHQVDAFTTHLFEGNSTAVIFGAEVLTLDEMKKIANETKHSETVFVLPSQEADLRLRYFTPNGSELKFCGHATIGALYALTKESRFSMNEAKQYFLHIETNAGILPMEIDMTNSPVFKFNLPHIDLVPAPYDIKDMAHALNIPLDLINLDKPLMLERTNNYLYFTVPSLEKLKALQIDTKGAIEFAKKDKIILFCALTRETFHPSNHVHARGFAPPVGVIEDPFTGSMQGGLAQYLFTNDMIPKTTKLIGSEQGHFIKRPGKALIEILHDDPIQVKLHAHAAHVFSTDIKME